MQTTNSVFMIRPAAFGFNHQTASSNFFQKKGSNDRPNFGQIILQEFNNFAAKLEDLGVAIIVFDDLASPAKPDAVFPNNWISLRGDTMILYPMLSPNRRLERRKDIIKKLQGDCSIRQCIDLSYFESENKFLEGTGSIVFDYQNRKAYACLSNRTHPKVLTQLCKLLDYKPIFFRAQDHQKRAIYHTNVMMNIGPDFVVFCSESLRDKQERINLHQQFEQDRHTLIDISLEQVQHFAGNMLCVHVQSTPYLILSETAYNSLKPTQVHQLEQHASLVPIAIPNIERIGGGSVRCMLTEIFRQNSF